jgi:hypothetical protein
VFDAGGDTSGDAVVLGTVRATFQF